MRNIFILISLSFFVTKPALACDFKNLLFGTSASHVVDQYDFNPLETEIEQMPKKGQFSIKEFGNVVCKNLPEGSFIEFTFIDDSLVKVKIENNSSSQPVLDELKNIFGENDDKDRKKSLEGKTKVAMWDVDKMSVLYMLGNDSKGGTIESADISSKMHHSLFQGVVEQKNKEIAKYLKENNLGKYNASSKGGSSSSVGNSGTSDGSYDPDALEKLKDGYDKSNESWKEKNQDNPRKGR